MKKLILSVVFVIMISLLVSCSNQQKSFNSINVKLSNREKEIARLFSNGSENISVNDITKFLDENSAKKLKIDLKVVHYKNGKTTEQALTTSPDEKRENVNEMMSSIVRDENSYLFNLQFQGASGSVSKPLFKNENVSVSYSLNQDIKLVLNKSFVLNAVANSNTGMDNDNVYEVLKSSKEAYAIEVIIYY